MRMLILLAIGLLTACSSRTDDNQRAISQVAGFYEFYLTAFLNDPPPAYDSQKMRRYVAADTLERLTMIQKIPEQGILGADYFTYTQDYDAAWIPAFEAGPAHDLMGGKVVDVYLGIGGARHEHLEAYLRQESGIWKIYRVRDVSSNYESPIFSEGRIKQGW